MKTWVLCGKNMVISCDFLGVLQGVDKNCGGDTWGFSMIQPNMDMHQVIRGTNEST